MTDPARIATPLLAVATALLVALLAPLALFNPWFVSLLQQRAEAAMLLGATQAQVDAATGTILAHLWLGGDFVVRLSPNGPPLLDAFERSHMVDVSGLLRMLAIITIVAVAVAILAGRLLRGRPTAIGGALVAGAGIVGAVAIVVAIVFAVAFDAAFSAFHELFFRQGTYLFGPNSNLIRLFPERFWYEASLTAGIFIVASALAVSVAGWRLLRHRVT
jgi:integral membrane protein (TIGR01906 family)